MTKHPTGIGHGICNYGNRKVERMEKKQNEHAKYTSCIELAKQSSHITARFGPVRDRFCLIERVCTRNPASLDRRSANIRLVQSIVLSDLVLSHPLAAGLTSNDSTFCLHCLLLHHLWRVTAMEDVGRSTRWGHSGICTVCRFWLCHVFMGCFRVCTLSLASFFS